MSEKNGLNEYGESKVDKPEPEPTTIGPEGDKSTVGDTEIEEKSTGVEYSDKTDSEDS